MKTFTFTFTPRDYLRIPPLFITMIVLTVTGWRWHNWQYWATAVVLAAIFILIDKRYGKKPDAVVDTLPTGSERARWIVDNTRYDQNNCKGSRVEFAFEHLLDEIEKALVAERQDVIEFFKKDCICMAMDKHIEKLNKPK